LILFKFDGNADGSRTAAGGYLASGKCPAYRGFRWRRCRHDRRRGGGYRARQQRVLRAPAVGQRVAKRIGEPVAKRVGYDGLRHGDTVGDSYNGDAHPDRQHIHHGGTDARANYAYANPHHAYAHANPHHSYALADSDWNVDNQRHGGQRLRSGHRPDGIPSGEHHACHLVRWGPAAAAEQRARAGGPVGRRRLDGRRQRA